CCDPSLVAMGHGEFAVMWRNVLGGSRDFYMLRLRDGRPVGPAVKQGDGTWKLDACPMDGGGIAVHDGQVASAWRREHDIYLAAYGAFVRLGSGARQQAVKLRAVLFHRADSATGDGE